MDALSFALVKGIVKKVLVESDAGSCWGVGSDIQIASSTLYNCGWPNLFMATITNKEVETKGTYLSLDPPPLIDMEGTYFLLDCPPLIIIITEYASMEYATGLAFVSRNVIIEGNDDDEADDSKGGNLQFPHTPNVTQFLCSMAFRNMGWIGEYDKFPIQFLYRLTSSCHMINYMHWYSNLFFWLTSYLQALVI